MFGDQLHLLVPIACRLKAAFDKRINQLLQEEIERNGIHLFDADAYKDERLKHLTRYADKELLRLASELGTQLVERSIVHAPYRIGNGSKGSKSVAFHHSDKPRQHISKHRQLMIQAQGESENAPTS